MILYDDAVFWDLSVIFIILVSDASLNYNNKIDRPRTWTTLEDTTTHYPILQPTFRFPPCQTGAPAIVWRQFMKRRISYQTHITLFISFWASAQFLIVFFLRVERPNGIRYHNISGVALLTYTPDWCKLIHQLALTINFSIQMQVLSIT